MGMRRYLGGPFEIQTKLTDNLLRRTINAYGCEEFAIVRYQTRDQHLSQADRRSCGGSDVGFVFRIWDQA